MACGRIHTIRAISGLWQTRHSMVSPSVQSRRPASFPAETILRPCSGKPEIALTSGSQYEPYLGSLSYLMGQRFSACTCPDDPSHPGPKKPDGTWKARSAPELDVIEAQVSPRRRRLGAHGLMLILDTLIGDQVDHTFRRGQVSQSGQFAPFNAGYYMSNVTGVDYGIIDDDVTQFNTFNGNSYQQSTSGLAYTDPDC